MSVVLGWLRKSVTLLKNSALRSKIGLEMDFGLKVGGGPGWGAEKPIGKIGYSSI